jgi:predicted kinase
VLRGAAGTEVIEALARKVAAFHSTAETNPQIASFDRFDAVAHNIRDNYTDVALDVTLSRSVRTRLEIVSENALDRSRPLIEARAARGVPRDVHGDLRLDHVYLFPERSPPANLVIIDCIEFAERFRWIDPVADMAFLVMDLRRMGRRDLAEKFTDTYFEVTGDEEGRRLLRLYTAYRATVRGKVEGLKYQASGMPEAERAGALIESRAHWLLALSILEEPSNRPCLVLMAGLPGAGKSSLARALAKDSGFAILRSDEVRKELAAGATDIFTPEWNERTYAECLRRTEALLFDGRRVVVDANFRADRQRRTFLEAAICWGVAAVLLVCRASPSTVRRRLAERRDDASNADWSVYEQLASQWEEPGAFASHFLHFIDTDGAREEGFARVRAALSVEGLDVASPS